MTHLPTSFAHIDAMTRPRSPSSDTGRKVTVE